MNPSNENAPERRITHADIARATGVSKTTVSLALSNHPRISESTRLRVREKADEMGYNPDPMLSALAQYRSNNQEKRTQAVLAWINPLLDPRHMRKQHEFDLYWEGASDAAQRLGYRLEEFCTKEISLSRMETIFKARNIQGIIIAGMLPSVFQDQSIMWKKFSWEDFATVRFGRKLSYPEAHFVTSAQTSNTIMAFTRMTERGYQRIGYIGEYTAVRVFYAGFLFAQLAVPEDRRIPPLLLPEEQALFSENKHLLEQWIDAYHPDAILTDDTLLHQMLEELGYRVPDDIGLATTTIHDTPIDAGVDQNPEEIGRAAVRTLVALLNERNFGIPDIRNEILIEGKWVDGSMLPVRT